MSVTQPEAVSNHLLATLDSGTLDLLLPKLTRVTMESRRGIYAPDGPIDFVYFPVSGMVSMVANLSNGMQAEVGVIGREGVVGLTLLSGFDRSFVEAMIQMPGTLLRMTAATFRQAASENAGFRNVMLRYSEALQTQIMQTAACNGRHELEQRLARWLLMSADRQDTDVLPLTQEFIAMMLGVHRPSITVTAGVLQRAGLITYGNGRIAITDRPGLEQASCGCYGAVRRRYESLSSQAATPA